MERISNALAIVRGWNKRDKKRRSGGAVRDLFLGRAELSDADVATSASLGAIRSLWEERVKVTRKGPPWTAVIPMDGFNVEVTPFLGETLEEDLKRRDFTVNALAMKADGKLIDVVDGVKDLSRRVLRFNGGSGCAHSRRPVEGTALARFAAVFRRSSWMRLRFQPRTGGRMRCRGCRKSASARRCSACEATQCASRLSSKSSAL